MCIYICVCVYVCISHWRHGMRVCCYCGIGLPTFNDVRVCCWARGQRADLVSPCSCCDRPIHSDSGAAAALQNGIEMHLKDSLTQFDNLVPPHVMPSGLTCHQHAGNVAALGGGT